MSPPPREDGGLPLPRATLRTLAERTVTAVAGVRPEPADQEWARSILTPEEHGLWSRLSALDRDHAVKVAKKVQSRLAATPWAGDTLWPGAALMHDIGKLDSGLSPVERAAAMLASRIVSVRTARRWASRARGRRRRIGSYLIHGELGARMIRDAGGREEIAAWTEVHQGDRDMDRLKIPPTVIAALLESDVR